MPVPVLPDAVALTIQALRAQPTLDVLVGGRVSDRVPASPVWPLLVVSVVDEVELEWHTGEVRVQVDVWGAGAGPSHKQQVRRIAGELFAVARDLRGEYPAGVVRSSSPLMSVPSPDSETGRQRVVVDLLLHTMSGDN